MRTLLELNLAPLAVLLTGHAMAGGAVSPRAFAVWGDGLYVWRGEERVIARQGHFGEGGCLDDIDGDGVDDAVVTEAGARPALVWINGAGGRRTVIDTGVVASDVIAATFDGRRGVLVLHKHGQLRFYFPDGGKWASRDVYSFYSAADQGGLLLSDIDGDGRIDILCGNYWVRQPESFELPWRLFAIKLWSDERADAITDFAFAGGRLLAVQREKPDGLAVWYTAPDEPRALWEGAEAARLAKPRIAGVRRGAALVSEAAGEGRLLLLRPGHPLEVAATGKRFARAWLRGDRLYSIARDGVRVWRVDP